MSTTGLTDIHCHILPGIDDGAQNEADALSLLRAQQAQSVSRLVLTPHFYPERESPADFLQRRSKAAAQMDNLIAESSIAIETRIGAEIQFTPVLDQMPLDMLCFSGTHYLLLELHPLYEPMDVEGMILRLRNRGYVPVLAHIERFPYIENDPALLWRWVRSGALCQINAGAVIHSKTVRKRLEQYYRWNLVHFMASDTHSISRRPPNLAQGYRLLSAVMAQQLQENAEKLFADQEICTSPPHKPVKRFVLWK